VSKLEIGGNIIVSWLGISFVYWIGIKEETGRDELEDWLEGWRVSKHL